MASSFPHAETKKTLDRMELQHVSVRSAEPGRKHDGLKRAVIPLQTNAASAAVKEEKDTVREPSIGCSTGTDSEGQAPYHLTSIDSPNSGYADEVIIVDEECFMKKRKDGNRANLPEEKKIAGALQDPSPVEQGEERVEEAQDVSRKRWKRDEVTVRCEPMLICEIVSLLNTPQREKVKEYGFGCLFDFKMDSPGSRTLVIWLMDHLDPETMNLDLGDGKKLPITEHTVWCLLGLQRGKLDPPLFTKKMSLLSLKQQLGIPETRSIIDFRYLKKRVMTGGTDRFTMQCFMMFVFGKLLACSSSFYVSEKVWSMVQDIENFGQMDWCRFTVDYLRYSARMWNDPGSNRTTAYGCSALLVMYYLDNLQCQHMMSCVETPRAKFFSRNVIFRLKNADMLKDEGCFPTFGNLNLRSQKGTCYDKHAPKGMPAADISDMVAAFPGPHNDQLHDSCSEASCSAKRMNVTVPDQQLDDQMTEHEQPQEITHKGVEGALAGNDKRQTPTHEQTCGSFEDSRSRVPGHGVRGAAEAVQLATNFVNEEMKDFMSGNTSEPEVLENRLSMLVSLIAQMRELVASQTRNSELEQQVKELSEKLRNTEKELDTAKVTLRAAEAATLESQSVVATINGLTLRLSATFVRLGETRSRPAPDMAASSLQEAVKMLEDRLLLVEHVARSYAEGLAKNTGVGGRSPALQEDGR